MGRNEVHNVPTTTNYMPWGGAYRCQSEFLEHVEVLWNSRVSLPPQHPLIQDSWGKEDRSPRPGAWNGEPPMNKFVLWVLDTKKKASWNFCNTEKTRCTKLFSFGCSTTSFFSCATRWRQVTTKCQLFLFFYLQQKQGHFWNPWSLRIPNHISFLALAIIAAMAVRRKDGGTILAMHHWVGITDILVTTWPIAGKKSSIDMVATQYTKFRQNPGR